ncbi:MAG TPA: thioredoxin [Candidatus Limisoma gallistercoris]|nr:thioredoxin [Candidatus Limisoma gallistercoris]
MKKLIMFSLMAAISLVACSQEKQSAASQPSGETAAAAVSDYKPVEMNTQMFIDRVVDFKNAKEWDYKGDKPAVIDFYATWCGPCKKLSPILDELSSEYAGNVLFYKVDVDREQELAGAFGIQSIPMVLLIPKEGKPYVVQGLRPKAELKEAIDSVLLK